MHKWTFNASVKILLTSILYFSLKKNKTEGQYNNAILPKKEYSHAILPLLVIVCLYKRTRRVVYGRNRLY